MRRLLRLFVLAPFAASALSAAPAAAEWPAWVERWLFNPTERTQRGVETFAEQADAAVPPLDTALRLAQDDPVAKFNAATARLAAGAEDAAPLLESAAETAGAALAPKARYNLGNARLEANDLPGAIEAYKQALRLDPGFQDAKFNLELAQRMLEEQQKSQDQQQDPQSQDQQQDQQNQDQQDQQGDGQGDEQQDQEQQNQDQKDQDQKDQDQKDQQDQEQQQDQQPQDPQQQDQQQDQQDQQQQDQQQQQQQDQQQKPDQQQSPLPQFRDLPEMTAEEAAAILEAIENMERDQRRQQALEAAKANVGRKKDW